MSGRSSATVGNDGATVAFVAGIVPVAAASCVHPERRSTSGSAATRTRGAVTGPW